MGLVLSNDRYVDDSGVPLNGAKMFVYEVGTETDAATFLDSDLTTPAAQPVLSNQFGIFAPIYIAGNYKLVFKTSADVVLPQFGGDDIEPASVGSATTTSEGTVEIATTAEVAAKTAGKVIDSGDQASMVFAGEQITTGTISLSRIDTAALLATIYPVGAVYNGGSNSTNPATLLGFGTWVAYAAGRAMIGVGTGTDINAVNLVVAGGAEAGEYEHTQLVGEMFKHGHDSDMTEDGGNSADKPERGSGASSGIMTTDLVGGTDAMNVTNPYIGTYLWERTA